MGRGLGGLQREMWENLLGDEELNELRKPSMIARQHLRPA